VRSQLEIAGALTILAPGYRCLLRGVVNWFRHYAFGSLGDEIALAILSFGLCTVLSKLISWLRTPERKADESDEEYWRIHG
jgi:hypothetical protein